MTNEWMFASATEVAQDGGGAFMIEEGRRRKEKGRRKNNEEVHEYGYMVTSCEHLWSRRYDTYMV